MDCSACDSYNRGRGQKSCLKCKKYKSLQIQYGKRESIRIEHLPQEIIDNTPDPYTVTLLKSISHLPFTLAVPMLMRAMLNASLQEIADYHNLSRSTIQQRVSKGIEIIKDVLITTD